MDRSTTIKKRNNLGVWGGNDGPLRPVSEAVDMRWWLLERDGKCLKSNMHLD